MRLKVVLDSRFVERAADPAALPAIVAHARRQVAVARRLCVADSTGDNPGILGRELGRLGDALRVADDPGARDVLAEVLALWDALNRARPAYLVRLKIADVDERAGASESALCALDRLVAQSGEEEFAPYRDFALHGRGAFHFRAGAFDKARVDLEAALALRQSRGRGRLVETTQDLLDLCRRCEASVRPKPPSPTG